MAKYDIDEILALERQVWAALMAGDGEADKELLSDDFLGVYKSGFAGRDAHARQLEDGPTVESYRLSETKLKILGENLVLLAYVADYVPIPGDGQQSRMYVSSIWKKSGEAWRNVFSQDTDAEA